MSDHHHHHHSGSCRKVALILAASLLLAVAAWIEHALALPTWQLLLVYLVPYLLVGASTLREAAEGIVHGRVFNEDFLMAVATIGALAIGFMPGADTEFAEAVFVMLFFQVGELFEGYAEGRSRDSIAHLVEVRPDTAHVERRGAVETVAPDEVAVGETIVVSPGERVPLDGVILSGQASLNTVALTGESMPRDVGEGDEIVSGCINLSGVLRVRTTRSFGESTVSRIIHLVESANEQKSRSESFISRFARVYTPIVVISAVMLAVVPPLFLGGMAVFAQWLHRALIFLVVSCPCALVISVPLTFFGGLGGASRRGILIKGSNYMDTLARLHTVVFDKTGTLTHGEFSVVAVHPEKCDERELLHLAAHVEHYSTHPIAAALREAFPSEATDGCRVEAVEELSGRGIRARVDGRIVCVGNAKMMGDLGVEWHDCHLVGTIIHVAIDGRYAGHIVINDRIKADSPRAVADLKALGVGHTVMLTGDREAVAADVARQTGIDEYHAQLLPIDKVSHVERLLAAAPRGATLAFVGDGINDAPVLKRADVGIAMGGLGSDAAIETADVVIQTDQPSRVATAIHAGRQTRRIVWQNISLAFGVKLLVLILGAGGIATLWEAVFADVGVALLAIMNAVRIQKMIK